MTSPSKNSADAIPDEVLREAQVAIAADPEGLDLPEDREAARAILQQFLRVLSRAIMAERERCAKIAKNAILWLAEHDRANGDICHDAIATAIRKGS